MPLLPLEPYVYPENLLTRLPTEESPPPPGPWWVVHTRPRTEKSLARKLLNAQHAFFLPLYRKTLQSRDRTRTAYHPLFPSYLFLHGEEARLAALQTNHVAQVLAVPDGRQLFTDLVWVYRVMQGEAPLVPEERLRPGTPVRIVRGPLAGLEGVVLREGKQFRVLIEVHFLQQGVSVEVDNEMVRPLD
jgi:transcriptional antiterminator RfaH